jgi:hypothetical protein
MDKLGAIIHDVFLIGFIATIIAGLFYAICLAIAEVVAK